MGQISQELKQLLVAYPLRWVKPDLQHITLKFLGDVDLSKVDEIDLAIKSNQHEMPGCSAALGGLGGYPNLEHPRVIWVGANPDEGMVKMHLLLETALAPLGFNIDQKGFFPHITLARISDRVSVDDKKAIGDLLKSIDIPVFSTQRFKSITLFKSDLQRSGPVYTRLHSYTLNGNLC